MTQVKHHKRPEATILKETARSRDRGRSRKDLSYQEKNLSKWVLTRRKETQRGEEVNGQLIGAGMRGGSIPTRSSDDTFQHLNGRIGEIGRSFET